MLPGQVLYTVVTLPDHFVCFRAGAQTHSNHYRLGVLLEIIMIEIASGKCKHNFKFKNTYFLAWLVTKHKINLYQLQMYLFSVTKMNPDNYTNWQHTHSHCANKHCQLLYILHFMCPIAMLLNSLNANWWAHSLKV